MEQLIEDYRKKYKPGFHEKFLDYIAEEGNLEIIKYLHEIGWELPSKWSIILSARNGRLDIVKYLHEKMDIKCSKIAMGGAVEHGHLNIIKYFYEECNVKFKPHKDYNICDAAAKGHLDIIKYLNEKNAWFVSKVIGWAVCEGQLEIIKYLHKNCKGIKYSKSALEWSKEYNHIDILNYAILIVFTFLVV